MHYLLRWMIFAVLLLGGAWASAAGTWRAGYEIFSRRSMLNRLLDTPPDVIQPGGFVHGRATLQSMTPDSLPPCRVTYQSRKGHLTLETVQDDAWVRFGSGGLAMLPARVDLELVGDDLRSFGTHDRVTDARARERSRKGGRVICAEPTDVLYAQGCLRSRSPSILGPCPGEDQVLFATSGSPRTLIVFQANRAALQVCLGLLGFLALSLTLWAGVSCPSVTVVDTPPNEGPPASTGTALFVSFIALVFAFAFAGMVAFGKSVPISGYLLAGALLLCLVACFRNGRARLVKLGRLRQALGATVACSIDERRLARLLARERICLGALGGLAGSAALAGVAALAIAAFHAIHA